MKYLLILIFTVSIYANSDSNSTKSYKLDIVGLKNIDKTSIAKAIGAKEEGFLNKKYIINSDFLRVAKDSIKSYMESMGYFNYKLNIDKNRDIVTLNINEGKPVRVNSIKIDSDIKIDKLIKFKKGDVFSSKKFLNIKDNIIKMLMQNGYCQYKLDAKAYVDLKNYRANLNYFLRKNNICKFGKITLAKKVKGIKDDVIFSRIKYKKGDIFSTKDIEESYLALNKLNVFANINIVYNLDKNSSVVDTKISLDKREKLKRYEIAIGHDSDIGSRFKGYWENRDIFKNATKISVSTQVSKRIQDIKSTLFIPAFITYKGKFLDYYLTVGAINEKEDGFNRHSFYLKSYFQLDYKRWSVKSGVGIENLHIRLKEKSDSIIGGTFNMIYPFVEAIYDARDSKLDPKNGYYIKTYWEYGLSSSQSGAVQYFKYLLEGRAIKSFDDLTLSAVGRVGLIKKFSGKLPASKLFYGGGSFNNRAYSKGEVGVVTSSKSYRKLGGKSMLNFQLEANYKLYKELYGAIFFDTTKISQSVLSFKGKRLDTLGVGLRYKTPIGPIKIDFGWNIHKFKENSISIMLGQSF